MPPSSAIYLTDDSDNAPVGGAANMRRHSAPTSPPDRCLTTHPIARPRRTNRRLVSEAVLSSSTDPKDREKLLQIKLMKHEKVPTEESEKDITTLEDRFEQELQIEKDDPVTLEEAIARVLKDVDDLFYGMEVSALRSHFFSSIESTPTSERRTTLEEQRARWMIRWVLTGPEGGKRDQWTRLVGFTGEYLVTAFYRDILICRFTASSKPCFRTLKSRTGRAG